MVLVRSVTNGMRLLIPLNHALPCLLLAGASVALKLRHQVGRHFVVGLRKALYLFLVVQLEELDLESEGGGLNTNPLLDDGGSNVLCALVDDRLRDLLHSRGHRAVLRDDELDNLLADLLDNALDRLQHRQRWLLPHRDSLLQKHVKDLEVEKARELTAAHACNALAEYRNLPLARRFERDDSLAKGVVRSTFLANPCHHTQRGPREDSTAVLALRCLVHHAGHLLRELQRSRTHV
mmetsp:Transcript_52121/g.111490  ORF Transcript_52121/g.111490 Transcript_52121/m.111490 type:complete len:236 (+) Transcript_52121:457-1164(+)